MLDGLDLVMAHELGKSINLVRTSRPNGQIYLVFFLAGSGEFTKMSAKKAAFSEGTCCLQKFQEQQVPMPVDGSFVSLDAL